MEFKRVNTRYYPSDDLARSFCKAFGHSRGMRKTITYHQLQILLLTGVHVKILETIQERRTPYD